jgi:hypothetical protein
VTAETGESDFEVMAAPDMRAGPRRRVGSRGDKKIARV